MSDITNATKEDKLPVSARRERRVGGVVERGVFKAYQNFLYNQLLIDPYACCLVAPFTGIANYTGVRVGYDVMRKAFAELKRTTFTPGVGDYLSNGVNMALKHYNLATRKNISAEIVELSEAQIIDSLKKGSPVVTGVKYGSGFFLDEQDNAEINHSKPGVLGHAVSIVKLNNYDDTLIKYAENYDGKHKYNIILMDFNTHRGLFFDTGFRFSGR